MTSSRRIGRFGGVLLLACLALGCVQRSPLDIQTRTGDRPPPAAPDAAAPRVLIISVDGLRPDLMLWADCPNLRALARRGSFSFWAQTTPAGVTLPSHASMVTGVTIERHGVHWNGSDPPDGVDDPYPRVPTLFDLAHAAGQTTAMAAGKIKFETLARPGTVDWVALPDARYARDNVTTDAAVRIITQHKPQVMLFHLADTDAAGHRLGWGSPEQLDIIEMADRYIGQIIDALRSAGVFEQTLIILSADHGGYGKTHRGGDPRGLHIPWIAAGPGVKQNYDLNQHKDLAVRTYDTFATACHHLGLPIPPGVDGRVVEEALE